MQISRAFLRLSGRLTIDYKERKRLYPNKKSWCLSFNHETDKYLKNVGSIVEYPISGVSHQRNCYAASVGGITR